MAPELELSDTFIADHSVYVPGMRRPPPHCGCCWRSIRKMHFTGLRGRAWKMLGVERRVKNPNICNK